MTYLLDTCIISKLRKKTPANKSLLEWFSSHNDSSYYLSSLTIGEIEFGITKMQSDLKKKTLIQAWFLGEVIPVFNNRILSLDSPIASLWGKIIGDAALRGITLPVIDSLIAATAIYHNMILVTDNERDFIHTGVKLLNPM